MTEDAEPTPDEKSGDATDNGLSEEEQSIEEIKRRVVERVQQEGASMAPDIDDGPVKIEEQHVKYALNNSEIGDAYLLSLLFRGRLLHDHQLGTYFTWSGNYWEKTISGIPYNVIEVVRDEYLRNLFAASEAANTARASGTPDRAAEGFEAVLRKKISQIQTAKKIESILKIARAKEPPYGIGFSGDKWDLNPDVLCCSNGVVDLQTGEISNGRPGDFIRAVAPTKWTGITTTCPIWEDSVFKVCGEDREKYYFIQRLLGYSITGHTFEQVLPIFYGSGSNGKSELFNTVSTVLGDTIVGTLSVETLLKQRNPPPPSAPRADRMPLLWSRILICQEPDEGRAFSASEIKSITGRDKVTARAPHGVEQIAFQTKAKLFVVANHLPKFDSTSFAMQRRLMPIPLNSEFRPNPQPGQYLADKELPKKLQAETSGILAWLVRGSLMWREHGLSPPEVVQDAARAYCSENDIIGQFVDEFLEFSEYGKAFLTPTYAKFRDFAEQNNERKPPSQKRFSKWLSEKHQIKSDRNYQGRFYPGVSLIET